MVINTAEKITRCKGVRQCFAELIADFARELDYIDVSGHCTNTSWKDREMNGESVKLRMTCARTQIEKRNIIKARK